jgi:hypothetical protein
VVSVPSAATDESLPVVIERLDAPGRRMMFAEGCDFIEMPPERFVQLSHGHVGALLRTKEDVVEPRDHRWPVGSTKYDAKLLDGLVGACELTVQVEEAPELRSVFIARALPGTQDEPAGTATDGALVGACTEEDLSSQLGDGFTGSLHDVKGVVDDCGVRERWVAAHGLLERLVHVHREELDVGLLRGRQRIKPLLEGILASSVADPERGTRLQVADDRDVLVLETVPPAEPLFIDADHHEGPIAARAFPALNRVVLCSAHGMPAQPVLRGDVQEGHREGVEGDVMLQTSRLALFGICPCEELDRPTFASRAIEPNRRVLKLDRVPHAGKVLPSTWPQLLMTPARNRKTLGATRCPPASHRQHEPRIDWDVVTGHRYDDVPITTLPPCVHDLPSPESGDLCKNSRALTHPGNLPVLLMSFERSTAMVRRRWVSAPLRRFYKVDRPPLTRRPPFSGVLLRVEAIANYSVAPYSPRYRLSASLRPASRAPEAAWTEAACGAFSVPRAMGGRGSGGGSELRVALRPIQHQGAVAWSERPDPAPPITTKSDNFSVSGRNVDWDKDGSYGGIVTGTLRYGASSMRLLKDYDDAELIGQKITIGIPGAANAGEIDGSIGFDAQFMAKVQVMKDDTEQGQMIRTALEQRDAQRSAMDRDARREDLLKKKSDDFERYNGVSFAEATSCEKD